MKLAYLAFAACALVACDKPAPSGGAAPPAATPSATPLAPSTAAPIVVTSTSFAADGPIPATFSCDGRGVMPALSWTAPPPSTGAQALVVEDPDAPSGLFTHLIAWNMGADARSIGEGSSPATVGGALGKNDFGKPGWGGPCPPKGKAHHYRFRVLALDAPLPSLKAGADRAAFDAAVKGHVLAEGALVGTFQR